MSINPYDDELGVSRRDLIKHSAAAVGGVLVGGDAALGTRRSAGGPDRQPQHGRHEVQGAGAARRLQDHAGRDADAAPDPSAPGGGAIQAAQACYTIVNALAPARPAAPAPGAPPLNPAVFNAAIVGHGGVGIVEEVGAMVKRVQVGDRWWCR